MKVQPRVQPSDEEIAAQVRQGDVEAFGLIVDRYEQKLLRYGRKFLQRTEDIQDIVQDVFMSAYRGMQSFDTSLRLSPWLYRIAHNAFVNRLRDVARGPLFIDLDTLLAHQVYEDPAESEREQKEMRRMLDGGLAKLSAKYREVLVLHYFEEMPYKDIADVLRIPMGTVSIRMLRAKQALADALKKPL